MHIKLKAVMLIFDMIYQKQKHDMELVYVLL